MDKEHDEYQTRDDVERLMRADEVHADPKRLKRAAERIHRTSQRLTKKKGGRSGTRSSSR